MAYLILDTRDLARRLSDLNDLHDDNPNNLDDDEHNERAELTELFDQLTPVPDAKRDGVTLISEASFPRYAEEFAEDCGLVPAEAGWPLTCIDWEEAARQLQQDYTSIEYQGVTYFYRE